MLAGGIGIFCALNQAYYGVFTLSDFSGGAFADAMGAMSRVATDAEDPMLSAVSYTQLAHLFHRRLCGQPGQG